MKLNKPVVALAALAFSMSIAACSGKNIHRELAEDRSVMMREWTLATHAGFEAGDRGAEYSNPVMAENTLIFGNRSVGLAAIYPGLSLTRWVLPIRGGVVSELTVDQGAVYFGGGDGFLYSVNIDNGRVNWRYEIRNPVISRPTINAGRLFITTSDDVVYAFDAGTGKWLWHYRRRSAQTATIHGASAPLVDGNEVLAGLSDGFLVSLSIFDGQLKSEKKLHYGLKFTDVDAHPVMENGVVYVPSYDGALYALKRSGSEVLWRFDAGGSKQVVVDENRLYLPSSDGTVYALQKETSKVLWKFELDSGVPTRVVVTDQHLIVGSSYQYLYVLNKETGKGIYRFNVGYGSGFSGSPLYDSQKQRLYLLSSAGNLYSFSLRTPQKKTRGFGVMEPYSF